MQNETKQPDPADDVGKSACSAVLSFVGDLSANDMMGWLFLGFGIAAALGIGIDAPNLTHSILWCVLAKLCWVHADIKER